MHRDLGVNRRTKRKAKMGKQKQKAWMSLISSLLILLMKLMTIINEINDNEIWIQRTTVEDGFTIFFSENVIF